MIQVVEDYLQDLITNKIALLKSKPNYIDDILMMNPTKREGLKTFITNQGIKVTKGYPRVSADLPSICILLSNDNETQEGLGDYAYPDNMEGEATEELTTFIDASISPYPIVLLENAPVTGISEVIHEDLGGVILPETDYKIVTPNAVSFSGDVVEGDVVTISYSYIASEREAIQTQFENNYRIEVWASNADLAVQLYYIVKWAILSGRDGLVNDLGAYRQRLSGSDFMPAPSFFPEFVYRRALTFWCLLTVSAPVEEDIEQSSYISDIEINQTID